MVPKKEGNYLYHVSKNVSICVVVVSSNKAFYVISVNGDPVQQKEICCVLSKRSNVYERPQVVQEYQENYKTIDIIDLDFQNLSFQNRVANWTNTALFFWIHVALYNAWKCAQKLNKYKGTFARFAEIIGSQLCYEAIQLYRPTAEQSCAFIPDSPMPEKFSKNHQLVPHTRIDKNGKKQYA